MVFPTPVWKFISFFEPRKPCIMLFSFDRKEKRTWLKNKAEKKEFSIFFFVPPALGMCLMAFVLAAVSY